MTDALCDSRTGREVPSHFAAATGNAAGCGNAEDDRLQSRDGAGLRNRRAVVDSRLGGFSRRFRGDQRHLPPGSVTARGKA